MTFETFVKEMLDWSPNLHAECSGYMDDDEQLAYVAVGCVLIPWLETCLETNDVATVAKVGSFLEAASVDSKNDERLENLIGIEIGEWISEVRERKLLLSHLGPETQRICSYFISRLQD